MNPGEILLAYGFGRSKAPQLEFDVLLNSIGDSWSTANLNAALAAASIGQVAFIIIQTQLAGATNDFVAKMSLTNGYDLVANEGNKLTKLSQVQLDELSLKYINIIALEAGVNLHITVYS